MSTRLFAQLCQIGGAIQRGLISEDDVAKFLHIGHKAAGGDNAAIEVQAAYEIAGDGDVSDETKKAVAAVLASAKPNPLFDKPA